MVISSRIFSHFLVVSTPTKICHSVKYETGTCKSCKNQQDVIAQLGHNMFPYWMINQYLACKVIPQYFVTNSIMESTARRRHVCMNVLTPLLLGWACYKWARDFGRSVQNLSSREELQHPPPQPPLCRGEQFFIIIKMDHCHVIKISLSFPYAKYYRNEPVCTLSHPLLWRYYVMVM